MPKRRSNILEDAQRESLSQEAGKAALLATIDLEVLGERIRRTRLEQKISQRDLTKDLFTSAYLSSLELGKTRPTYRTLSTLAQKLGKSLDYFLRPTTLAGAIENPEELQAFAARFALLELEVSLSGEQESGQAQRMLEELERLHLSRLSEREKASFYLLKGLYYRLRDEEAAAREALERVREYLSSLKSEDWNEPGAEGERVLVAAGLEYEEGQISLSQRKGLAALNHFDRGLELMAQVLGNPTREPSGIDLSAGKENSENYQDNFKSLLEKVRMRELLPGLWLGAGQARLLLGELEEAARTLENVLKYEEEPSRQPHTRARLYQSLAQLYLEQGEYLRAGFYLGRSEELFKAEEERQKLVTVLSELAALEVRLGRYSEARTYSERALAAMGVQTGASKTQSGSAFSGKSVNLAESGKAIAQLVTLARVEAGQSRLEEALSYVEEGLALAEGSQKAGVVAPLYLVAAEVYKRLDRREEAEAYYEKTLKALEEEAVKEAGASKVTASKTLLAEVYYSYGQSLREWGETSRAFEYLEKAYRLREPAR